MCAAAGSSRCPDEAREQAQALKRVLIPAFEVSFSAH